MAFLDWQADRTTGAARIDMIGGQRALSALLLADVERFAGTVVPLRSDVADDVRARIDLLATRTVVVRNGGNELDVNGTPTGHRIVGSPAAVAELLDRPGGVIAQQRVVRLLVDEALGDGPLLTTSSPELTSLRREINELIVVWNEALHTENDLRLADRRGPVALVVLALGFGLGVYVVMATHRQWRRSMTVERDRLARTLAAERRLASVLDRVHDTVVIMDRDKHNRFISEGIRQLLGGSPEDYLGRRRSTMLHPDDADRMHEVFLHLYEASGNEASVEYRAQHVDGRWVPVEMRAINLLDDPAIEGVLLTLRDLSEQRAAEQRLAESESLHRALVDANPDAVVVIENLVVVSANPAAARVRGVAEPAELVGTSITDIVVPDDQSVIIEAALRFAGGGSFDEPIQMRVQHLDGHVRSCEARPVAVPGLPTTTTALVVIHDVTERSQLIAELAASEERGRFLAENATDVLLRVGADRRIEFASTSASDVLDLSPDDIGGVDIVRLFVAEHQDAVVRAFAQAHESGAPTTTEALVSRSGYNDRLWVEVTVRAVITTTGEVGYHVSISDIALRRAALDDLATSERRHRALVDAAPIGIFEDDAWGQRLYTNAAYLQILDIDDGERVLGTGWMDFSHPDELPAVRQRVEQGVTSPQTVRLERTIVRPSGEHRAVDICIVPMFRDGHVTGYLGTVVDTTDQRKLREELQLRERRFRRLADGATDVIYRLSLDGDLEFEYVSPSIERATGRTPDEIMADTTFALMLHEEDLPKLAGVVRRPNQFGAPERLELRWIHVDGAERWADHSYTVERDASGRAVALDVIARDITDQKRTEQELHDLAFVDTLTGLPNRRAVLRELDRRIADKDPTAVLFMDLDGFKKVNDTLGHEGGDELLREVSRRLQTVCRSSDMVGRLAGDEFVVVSEPAAAMALAERMLDSIRAPYLLSGGPAKVSGSIGVAVAELTDDGADVLRRADEAMYAAKHAGKSQIREALEGAS
jgi:diguanylate cyclase (GGDEF)-like protein/PAS domain S-box-containing protein